MAATARLELRVRPDTKARLERAAALAQSQSVTSSALRLKIEQNRCCVSMTPGRSSRRNSSMSC